MGTAMKTDIKQGQATGFGYVYQAAVYCEACGEAIRERLTAEGNAPEDEYDETSYDSDDYPKGPDEIGEADYAMHCEECGVFLENDLTSEGTKYVTGLVHESWGRWDLTCLAITEWAPFYDINAPDYVGPEKPMSYERRIDLVNAPQDGDDGECFVFAFGAYGDTYVAAWGRRVEDALEEAAGWLADNAPGHLTDLEEEYQREYRDARALGATEEQAEEHARETSEMDMTYTESGWLCSWGWTIALENPTREEMSAFLGVK